MKANELRIGNFVNYNNRPIQIEVEDFTDFYTDDEGCCYSSLYSPIPLTEEILLKCGFAKITENRCSYLIKIANETSLILDYMSDGLDISIGYSYEWGTIERINIKHLHQLQNLYFALTGEELNIEL